MKIGQEIFDRRKALGISRDFLSNRARVARSALQRIEGGGGAHFRTIEKITDALGVMEAAAKAKEPDST